MTESPTALSGLSIWISFVIWHSLLDIRHERMRRRCSVPTLTPPSQYLSCYKRFARWCNGSTADSGSVCHGSNPCRAANARRLGVEVGVGSFAFPQNSFRPVRSDAFMTRLVAHHYRGSATTGQAFDKFDREFAVGGG